MLDFNHVKQSATGRWLSIFRALGVDVREDGRHGPCPACSPGDKRSDRFRLDKDSAERGTYYCSGCNPGDGVDLVQKVLKVDFKGAMEAIAQVVGNCEKNAIPKEKTITPAQLRKFFDGGHRITERDPAGIYLKNRGLKTYPQNALWYAPECWEPETKKKQKAMLAVYQMPDTQAVCCHRTFIDDDGNKLQIKKTKKLTPALVQSITSGAVRLFETDGDLLGIGEGIETCLAAHEDMNIPIWAALSSALLEGWVPPDSIKEVVIIGDNDLNYTGQKSAYTLANRVEVLYKKKATVYIPEKPGHDWLDQYTGR